MRNPVEPGCSKYDPYRLAIGGARSKNRESCKQEANTVSVPAVALTAAMPIATRQAWYLLGDGRDRGG